jgi:hypothetical protein
MAGAFLGGSGDIIMPIVAGDLIAIIFIVASASASLSRVDFVV